MLLTEQSVATHVLGSYILTCTLPFPPDALEDGRKAVKWATDYFIKAHVNQNEFYGQIGKVDHSIWCRPEDMQMNRSAYKIDISHPGKLAS